MRLHSVRKYLLFPDQHRYLSCADECYFADVYQCNERLGIRSAILSLKRSNKFAVAYFAEHLRAALKPEWESDCTFVPMPSSSGDRNNVRSILHHMMLRDCRDMLIQSCPTPPAHRGWRLAPRDRAELFSINVALCDPRPSTVVIFDDVLTTGSHFRAAKMALRRKWPDLYVIGLFLARVCSYRERCHAVRLQASRPSCLMGSDWALFSRSSGLGN